MSSNGDGEENKNAGLRATFKSKCLLELYCSFVVIAYPGRLRQGSLHGKHWV